MPLSQASWIWLDRTPEQNEYALFQERFTTDGSAPVTVFIAAETDYVLEINGKLAGFGQFAGYPFEKYYDTIDISALCHPGENEFSVTVRYEGYNSATHIDDGAGVIFSVRSDDTVLAVSGAHTKGSLDDRYLQHQTRKVTVQLGLSSGMCSGEGRAEGTCVTHERNCRLLPRPVKPLQIDPFLAAKAIEADGEIYDLGRQEAGYLRLTIRSDGPCEVKVAYGEHLADGCVRYRIDHRNFSLDFASDGGTQTFTQLFVRIAGRYLQVFRPQNAEIVEIGILPALYPQIELPHDLTGLDAKIYDTCVRTLRLCMHTHYEDTPWREQALYVLDSRNQMLCGYYAFAETAFQRANLVFIAKGTRPDGLLELTYPAVDTPAIPFFSVMYPAAVWEYVRHTGDQTILAETMDTMQKIMTVLRSRIDETGLIPDLEKPYWNFYEWAEGSDGDLSRESFREGKVGHHLILNCAFVYAAERFGELCKLAGTTFKADLSAMREAIRNRFFNPETGIFALYDLGDPQPSQLGNAFALLIGLGDARTASAVRDGEGLVPATLSMLGFVYDALLASDPQNKDFVLADIRKKYGYMLESGATSFWETIVGEADFNNAGSLCHGWSAMPIYYYRTLL